MSYGISIINNNNITLIDQDYLSYGIYSQGTIPIGGNITIPSIASIVILATINDRLQGNLQPGTVLSLPPGTPYMFLVPTNALTGLNTGYGFNICDASGNYVFSSNALYSTLQSIQVMNLNTLYNQFTPYVLYAEMNVTLPASSKTRYFGLANLFFVGTATVTDYKGTNYTTDVWIDAVLSTNTNLKLSITLPDGLVNWYVGNYSLDILIMEY